MDRVDQNAPVTRPSGSNDSLPLNLLIAVLACVATLLCYRVFVKKFDHGLKTAVTKQLSELFPDTRIYIRRVESDKSGQITLSDVRLTPKNNRSKRNVFKAQRIQILGDLDIAHWAQDTISIQHVDLHGVSIHAWPEPDGNWSITCLEPKTLPGAQPPNVSIYDATIKIQNTPDEMSEPVILQEINGHFISRKEESQQPLTAELASQPKQLELDSQTINFELSGQSRGLLRSVRISGFFAPQSKRWRAKGQLNQLQFSQKLISKLPHDLAKTLTQVAGLQCIASVSQFVVTSQPNAAPKFELIGGKIESGRLQDERLQYPLDNVNGDFYCNNAMLQLRSMVAHSGSTTLQLSADIEGFTPDSPVNIKAHATALKLDDRLYNSLPEKYKQQWDRLKVSGQVSGNINLTYDGKQWTPSAILRCTNTSIQPWLFPYPLTDLSGPISFQNGSVSSSGLTGLASGEPFEYSFGLYQSAGEWLGWLRGKMHGPVPINEQLISALSPNDQSTTAAETFVRSLDPSGVILLNELVLERNSPSEQKWHRTLDANVFGGSINYDRFQYPVYDIRGRIYGKDDQWSLVQFEGRNDSGRILCSGNWRATDSGDIPFKLEFKAFAVPLEEELQNAFPLETQQVWAELQPTGSVDFVRVEIDRPTSDSAINTYVYVKEDDASNRDDGRSLRMRPRYFPYLLSNMSCEIEYQNGFIDILKVSGSHGSSRIAFDGDCSRRNDGRWQANVNWRPQTRLVVDQELLTALPGSVRDSLVKIDFRGPVTVLGKSQFVFSNQAYTRPATFWDCSFDVENGMLGDGKNIGDLRGTVWMQGASDGTQLSGSGMVAMDALTLKEIPMFGLKGPFALRGSNLYFGAEAVKIEPTLGTQQPTMTANALAGKLLISGIGQLDQSGKFFLDAQLQEAELSSLLQDVGVNQATPQALCNVSLKFDGTPWNPQTWGGGGTINLTDAQLFELPFMIRLLSVASVNAKDDSAFQSAKIDFKLDGDRILLSEINCDGDILRLRGKGWTNLHHEIGLELYSYVGRKSITSVLAPVIPESQSASFMVIEVGGTLDNPTMQSRTFPQLAIQQMFPDIAEQQGKRRLIGWRK